MLTFFVALLLQYPVGADCEAEPGVQAVTLSVGVTKLLTVPASVLRVTPSKVVELRQVAPHQFLVIGQSAGLANISFEGADGGTQRLTAIVRKGGVCDPKLMELVLAFPCGSTLEVKQVGERVILDGEASSLDEWRALFAVQAKYPNLVVLGHLSDEVIKQTFLAAQRALEQAGVREVRWVAAGEAVLLDGTVSDEQLRALRAHEAVWRPRLELALRRR